MIDGRVICLYRCSTGPAQALGCDTCIQDIIFCFWSHLCQCPFLKYIKYSCRSIPEKLHRSSSYSPLWFFSENIVTIIRFLSFILAMTVFNSTEVKKLVLHLPSGIIPSLFLKASNYQCSRFFCIFKHLY